MRTFCGVFAALLVADEGRSYGLLFSLDERASRVGVDPAMLTEASVNGMKIDQDELVRIQRSINQRRDE
jgi:hypothetical protein